VLTPGPKKNQAATNVLQTIQHRHEQTRQSYRRLIRRYDLPRSKMLRWQANVRHGDPPIRAPGPKKLPLPDATVLDQQIAALPHGQQRTRGTAALYAAWRAFLSRDLLHRLVAEQRRSLHREERDRLQLLSWQHPGTVWAMDEAEMDGIRWLLVTDLASRYRFDLLLADALPADRIVGHLDALFRRHTPPLALKRDNGPMRPGSCPPRQGSSAML
jgi:hypothetical protein